METETIMAKKAAQQLLRFKGFISPRYTQVPDALFDELMAYLSGAELKVLLYIIRRTLGFKKRFRQYFSEPNMSWHQNQRR